MSLKPSIPLHFSELIPKYRTKSSLNLFLGLLVFFDVAEHKIYIILLIFSCGRQHPLSQRLGVNQSNMAVIIKSTSQIKIPPCTFLIDRAQQQKHRKVQVKDLKIATFFLQMLEKSTSTFNLTTKCSTCSSTAIFEKGEERSFLVHIE